MVARETTVAPNTLLRIAHGCADCWIDRHPHDGVAVHRPDHVVLVEKHPRSVWVGEDSHEREAEVSDVFQLAGRLVQLRADRLQDGCSVRGAATELVGERMCRRRELLDLHDAPLAPARDYVVRALAAAQVRFALGDVEYLRSRANASNISSPAERSPINGTVDVVPALTE